MESKLYVGNLAYHITEHELRELFGQAGEIKDVTVILDRHSGRSKGFGFVEMMTAAGAEKAIQMFNDFELQGRRLIVNIARPREERPRGMGGGGGGGFRGGGRDRGGGSRRRF